MEKKCWCKQTSWSSGERLPASCPLTLLLWLPSPRLVLHGWGLLSPIALKLAETIDSQELARSFHWPTSCLDTDSALDETYGWILIFPLVFFSKVAKNSGLQPFGEVRVGQSCLLKKTAWWWQIEVFYHTVWPTQIKDSASSHYTVELQAIQFVLKYLRSLILSSKSFSHLTLSVASWYEEDVVFSPNPFCS